MTYNEAIPLTSAGLFQQLPAAADVIWDASSREYADTLYSSHRGGFPISPLLGGVNRSEPLTPTEVQKIAALLWFQFGESWLKLYNTLNLVYNPIENYKAEETESTETTYNSIENHSGTDMNINTPEGAESVTTSEQTTYGKRNTTIREGGNTTTPTGTETTATGVYGFGSTTPSPSDTQTKSYTDRADTVTEHDNITVSDDGVDSNATTQATTYNNRKTTDDRTTTAEDTHTGTDTTTRTYTRAGNIGVTTSQQMIESEHKLWTDWNFLNAIFSDIDKTVTSPFYVI